VRQPAFLDGRCITVEAAFDQTSTFKLAGSIRDGWPLDAQHVREQVLSDREHVTAICGHASSAANAQPLLEDLVARY
jgi:hypothetical protein